MDNIIILIELGAVVVIAATALLYQRMVINRLANRINRLETNHRSLDSKALLLENRDDYQTSSLKSLWEALKTVQDHIGVVTPEQLERMAAVDRIRSEYRSLGLAVDADDLDENQLRELESALLTLKVVPIRRETDAEVDSDLQIMIDTQQPDNTGPLPHATDYTDEQPVPFNGGTLAEWEDPNGVSPPP